MATESQEKRGKEPWLSRFCCGLCCCFGWCCSGYECCCCVERDREKRPLLSARDADGLGINGQPIPKDQELQEMEYKFSTPSSPAGSTPWGSEARSEASEPPDDIDIEPIEEQPRATRQNGASSAEHSQSKSWKLLSTEASMPQSQFSIQIRKQTD